MLTKKTKQLHQIFFSEQQNKEQKRDSPVKNRLEENNIKVEGNKLCINYTISQVFLKMFVALLFGCKQINKFICILNKKIIIVTGNIYLKTFYTM